MITILFLASDGKSIALGTNAIPYSLKAFFQNHHQKLEV